MANLSYSVEVQLNTLTARNLAYETEHFEGPFFPYMSVTPVIQEIYHCPFCGQKMEDFRCSCDAFKEKLAILQRLNQDSKDESRLHTYISEDDFTFRRPIASVITKQLDSEEILMLNPDTWDNAKEFYDYLTKRVYLVGVGTYNPDSKEISFYCKNLGTKDVYLCKLENIKYKALEVYLGIHKYERTPKVYTIGPYKQYYSVKKETWTDIAKYNDWEDFCQKINELGELKNALFIRAFF